MFPIRTLITRVQNLFQGGLKKNIFLLHLPKCAGTSISHAIRCRYLTLNFANDRNLISLSAEASSNVIKQSNKTDYPYNTTDDFPILKLRKDLLLYFLNQKNTKYISGHFPFSETAYNEFHNKFEFITVLRDPVKRFISSYFYNKYKEGGHRKIKSDIKTYIRSEFGQSQGYEFVKFLGGADITADYSSKQAVERAICNLKKFDIVGCLEYPKDFLDQFEARFAIRLKIEKKNPGPKPQNFKEAIITEEIQEQIKDICKPDSEVYQFAIDNFVNSNR